MKASYLISKDKQRKVLVVNFMQKYFKDLGFKEYKYKKNSFKFFKHIKIYISKLLLVLNNSKIHFGNPPKKKIIIFDCESQDTLLKIVDKNDCFILSTRIKNFKEIYLSLNIFRKMVVNLFSLKLKINYLLSLIETISPKVVITHVCHSTDFHIISKKLNKKYGFVAFQHAHHDLIALSQSSQKLIHIPNLVCFSDYEKEIYKKKKFDIKNFYVLGSLRSSVFNENILTKFKHLIKNENKYDICLVSEAHYILNGDLSEVINYPGHAGKIAQYVFKLKQKKNLKVVFSGDTEPDSVFSKFEFHFYKHFLKDYNFDIIQKKRIYFPTYEAFSQSKLVIGSTSTILREALGFEKKILSCNFSGNDHIDFPIKGICFLKDCEYDEFEERVMKILSLNKKDYFDKIDHDYKYLMYPEKNNINKFKNIINSHL